MNSRMGTASRRRQVFNFPGKRNARLRREIQQRRSNELGTITAVSDSGAVSIEYSPEELDQVADKILELMSDLESALKQRWERQREHNKPCPRKTTPGAKLHDVSMIQRELSNLHRRFSTKLVSERRAGGISTKTYLTTLDVQRTAWYLILASLNGLALSTILELVQVFLFFRPEEGRLMELLVAEDSEKIQQKILSEDGSGLFQLVDLLQDKTCPTTTTNDENDATRNDNQGKRQRNDNDDMNEDGRSLKRRRTDSGAKAVARAVDTTTAYVPLPISLLMLWVHLVDRELAATYGTTAVATADVEKRLDKIRKDTCIREMYEDAFRLYHFERILIYPDQSLELVGDVFSGRLLSHNESAVASLAKASGFSFKVVYVRCTELVLLRSDLEGAEECCFDAMRNKMHLFNPRDNKKHSPSDLEQPLTTCVSLKENLLDSAYPLYRYLDVTLGRPGQLDVCVMMAKDMVHRFSEDQCSNAYFRIFSFFLETNQLFDLDFSNMDTNSLFIFAKEADLFGILAFCGFYHDLARQATESTNRCSHQDAQYTVSACDEAICYLLGSKFPVGKSKEEYARITGNTGERYEQVMKNHEGSMRKPGPAVARPSSFDLVPHFYGEDRNVVDFESFFRQVGCLDTDEPTQSAPVPNVLVPARLEFSPVPKAAPDSSVAGDALEDNVEMHVAIEESRPEDHESNDPEPEEDTEEFFDAEETDGQDDDKEVEGEDVEIMDESSSAEIERRREDPESEQEIEDTEEEYESADDSGRDVSDSPDDDVEYEASGGEAARSADDNDRAVAGGSVEEEASYGQSDESDAVEVLEDGQEEDVEDDEVDDDGQDYEREDETGEPMATDGDEDGDGGVVDVYSDEDEPGEAQVVNDNDDLDEDEAVVVDEDEEDEAGRYNREEAQVAVSQNEDGEAEGIYGGDDREQALGEPEVIDQDREDVAAQPGPDSGPDDGSLAMEVEVAEQQPDAEADAKHPELDNDGESMEMEVEVVDKDEEAVATQPVPDSGPDEGSAAMEVEAVEQDNDEEAVATYSEPNEESTATETVGKHEHGTETVATQPESPALGTVGEQEQGTEAVASQPDPENDGEVTVIDRDGKQTDKPVAVDHRVDEVDTIAAAQPRGEKAETLAPQPEVDQPGEADASQDQVKSTATDENHSTQEDSDQPNSEDIAVNDLDRDQDTAVVDGDTNQENAFVGTDQKSVKDGEEDIPQRGAVEEVPAPHEDDSVDEEIPPPPPPPSVIHSEGDEQNDEEGVKEDQEGKGEREAHGAPEAAVQGESIQSQPENDVKDDDHEMAERGQFEPTSLESATSAQNEIEATMAQAGSEHASPAQDTLDRDDDLIKKSTDERPPLGAEEEEEDNQSSRDDDVQEAMDISPQAKGGADDEENGDLRRDLFPSNTTSEQQDGVQPPKTIDKDVTMADTFAAADPIRLAEQGTNTSGNAECAESLDPGYEAAEEDAYGSKPNSGNAPSYDSASQDAPPRNGHGEDYDYDATAEESQGHATEDEEKERPPVEVRAQSEADTERSSGMEEIQAQTAKGQTEIIVDGYEAEESQGQSDEEMPPSKEKVEPSAADGYEATAEENTEEDEKAIPPSKEKPNRSEPDGYEATAEENTEEDEKMVPPSKGKTEPLEPDGYEATAEENTEEDERVDKIPVPDKSGVADGYLPTGDESQGNTEEDEERPADAMDESNQPGGPNDDKDSKNDRHVEFAPLHKSNSHLDPGYIPEEEHTEDDLPKSKPDGGDSSEYEETKAEKRVPADSQSLSGMSAADEGASAHDSSDLEEDVHKETQVPIPALQSTQGSTLQDFATQAQQQNERQHNEINNTQSASGPQPGEDDDQNKNPTPSQYRVPPGRQTSAITFGEPGDIEVESPERKHAGTNDQESTVVETKKAMSEDEEKDSLAHQIDGENPLAGSLAPIPEDNTLEEENEGEAKALLNLSKVASNQPADDSSVGSTSSRRRTRSMGASDEEAEPPKKRTTRSSSKAASPKESPVIRTPGRRRKISDSKKQPSDQSDNESVGSRTRSKRNAALQPASDSESVGGSVRRSKRRRVKEDDSSVKSGDQEGQDVPKVARVATPHTRSRTSAKPSEGVATRRRRAGASAAVDAEPERQKTPAAVSSAKKTRKGRKKSVSEEDVPVATPKAKSKSTPSTTPSSTRVLRSRKKKSTGESDQDEATSSVVDNKEEEEEMSDGTDVSHIDSPQSLSKPKRRSRRLRIKRERPLHVALAVAKMKASPGRHKANK